MATFDDIARMRAALMAEKRQRMAQHPQQVAGAVGQAQGALAALADHLRQQRLDEDNRTRQSVLDKERNRHNLAMEQAALLRAQREPGKASEAKDAYRAEMTEKLRLQNEETRRERERREAMAKAQASGQIEDPAPDMPDGDEDVFVEDLETPAEKKKRIDASRAEFDLEQKQKPRGPGKPKKPKPKDLDAWTASARTEARLSSIRGLANDVGSGRLKDGIARAAQALGLPADAGFVRLRSRAMQEVNATMKELSGAAVSDQEMERVKAALPMPSDNPETFLIKLEEWYGAVRSVRLAEEFKLKQSGISVPGFDEFSATLGGSAAAEPGPVETGALEFRTPGGKVVRLTREQYDKLSPATRKALKRVR